MDRSWEYINRSQTNIEEIGAEAAQFPEKEYINGIADAVCTGKKEPTHTMVRLRLIYSSKTNGAF